MKPNIQQTLVAIAALSLLAAGCAKKQARVSPPPAAPAATSTVAKSTPPPASTPTSRSTPTTPSSRYPDAATRARIDQLLAKIEDAYFDYNKATLRTDALQALHSDSVELRDILKDYPDYKLTIQGYCDERGSEEYNLALGDRRAESAKKYLVDVGIPSAQLNVVSFGKEHPVCTEHDEACWQRNRRIHILAMAETPSR